MILSMLGNRFVKIGLLIVALIIGYGAWSYHMQKVGALGEQAKQQAAQVIQDKITMEALSQRLASAKVAQARSQAESRRYQEALHNDPETIDWSAACGSRMLPARLREYIEGTVPATSGASVPNSDTSVSH